jgi:7,8-dihydroneopterin aldolase/epimerase/oxygenase
MDVTTDKILLGGIEFYGHIGVSAAEREVGQRFVVDVELDANLAQAGASDNLADTISYAEVYDVVVSLGQNRHCLLVESLAEEIAHTILNRFPAQAVMVRVKKCPPPINGVIAYAGVEIRRRRSGAAGA